MRGQWFLGGALALLLSAGCGPGTTPPTGDVYRGKTISEWGSALKSPDAKTRAEAAKVLYQAGKEGHNTNYAMADLRPCLDDPDPVVQGWAALAVIYASHGTPFPVGAVVRPKIKEAAESSDPELRAEAEDVLKKAPETPAGGPGGPGMGMPPGARPPAGEQGPAGTRPEGKGTTPEEKKAAPKDTKPVPAGKKGAPGGGRPAEDKKGGAAKEKS